MINHVAIILDGNRRYARKKGWSQVWKGHIEGFNKLEDLTKWCKEFKIKELTLYCFSTENFKRDKKEISFLFDLFRERIDDFINDERIKENEIRIKFIGRLEMFPKDMQTKMNKLIRQTSGYSKFGLNLAMAYGGRQEIVDSVKKIIKQNCSENDVNEDLICHNMYGIPDVDLFIRPGGEKRLSNFLLWQSSYAELWFTDKLWPEFDKSDFKEAIDWYDGRERRFGI